jgi:hypothetical protein
VTKRAEAEQRLRIAQEAGGIGTFEWFPDSGGCGGGQACQNDVTPAATEFLVGRGLYLWTLVFNTFDPYPT